MMTVTAPEAAEDNCHRPRKPPKMSVTAPEAAQAPDFPQVEPTLAASARPRRAIRPLSAAPVPRLLKQVPLTFRLHYPHSVYR
jgi:hypothetical protein